MQVIRAKTINDAWFQCLSKILEPGVAYRTGTIERGSFAGEQGRLQFPAIAIEIEYPAQDRVVTIPEGSGIPAPTDQAAVFKYFEDYLLGADLKENEQYTYGSRINQSLWHVISILRGTPTTNQAVIEIGRPEDIELPDPPCLRLIDFKSRRGSYMPGDGERPRLLDMTVYFRSWDLYAGMPENLGGLSLLQEFVADHTGMAVGRMFCYASGLHLYRYQKELAEMRTHKQAEAF